MTFSATFCDECGASNPLQATHCFACNSTLQSRTPSPFFQVQAATRNAAALIGPLVPSSLLHSRYSIVSQVGTGGFGAVYQAKDTLFSNRLVAIKEMSQDGLSPHELAEAAAAFEREALLLADLIHPNLPRIHDHFSEHGRSYVVMDFIAGDTLEDYLDKVVRHLPIEAALEIGLQLCTVLDYLHTHQPPLIFRDLKPANIMRTADNHVYLIDFGIARHFKPGKARDTIPLGSKGYAAPEQYGKAQTTPQTDGKSVVAGGDDAFVWIWNATTGEIRSIYRGQADWVIMVACSADGKYIASGSKDQTVQVWEAGTGRQVVIYRGHSSGIGSVAWSPDGRYIASASFDMTVQIWEAATGRPVFTYLGHSKEVYTVAWSPDGQRIASGGKDHTVQVWPVALFESNNQQLQQSSVITYFGHAASVQAVTWSPDGSSIASAGDNVQIWNAITGKHIFTYAKHTISSWVLEVQAVAWSPNGRYIASGGMEGTVQVWNAMLGKR